jgi:hypothetical protein
MGLYYISKTVKKPRKGFGYQVRKVYKYSKLYYPAIRSANGYEIGKEYKAIGNGCYMEDQLKYKNGSKLYPAGFHIIPTYNETIKFQEGICDRETNTKIVLVKYRNVHTIGKQKFGPFQGKVLVAKYVTIIKEVTEEVLK